MDGIALGRMGEPGAASVIRGSFTLQVAKVALELRALWTPRAESGCTSVLSQLPMWGW